MKLSVNKVVAFMLLLLSSAVWCTPAKRNNKKAWPPMTTYDIWNEGAKKLQPNERDQVIEIDEDFPVHHNLTRQSKGESRRITLIYVYDDKKPKEILVRDIIDFRECTTN